MAEADGAQTAGLTQRLLREGHVFDFFQAVRLLERWADRTARDSGGEPPAPVGGDAPPAREAVRFRGHPSLTFPASEIHEIGSTTPGVPANEGDWPLGMEVSFLGLIGPLGALPLHYTSLVIQRLHAPEGQDVKLREFLDLFHHRAVALFYRAWEKCHFPFLYERCKAAGEVDPVSFALAALVGLATDGLARRLAVDDETLVYFSGHYGRQARSAVALEALLSDYFAARAEVKQFPGRWITLAPEERSQMPTGGKPRGQHMCLGKDTILGARVWNMPTKFRVTIGPVSYARFRDFLPTGSGFAQLCDLTRTFAGPELSYDVQVVLRKEDVPCARLQGDRSQAYRLGWNSWSHARPYQEDAAQPIFRARDDV